MNKSLRILFSYPKIGWFRFPCSLPSYIHRLYRKMPCTVTQFCACTMHTPLCLIFTVTIFQCILFFHNYFYLKWVGTVLDPTRKYSVFPNTFVDDIVSKKFKKLSKHEVPIKRYSCVLYNDDG